MAKRLLNGKGQVVAIELAAGELAASFGVDTDTLRSWKTVRPSADGTYTFKSSKDYEMARKRAMLLRTHMNEQAVAAIEEAGLLDSYAALAEDCPAGITAHVWRSYAVVVLMQVRYGRMIGAAELAQRANLLKLDADGNAVADVELARKHLRLLRHVGGGYLRVGQNQWAGQWEHRGLPKAWRGE